MSAVAKWASVIIAVLTAAAAITVRFVSLEEAKKIATENIAELQRNVRALERDRQVLERVHSIEVRQAEIATEIQYLREDVKQQKKGRR